MREFTKREQDTLDFLGNFGPTVKPALCEIKGWMNDDEGSVCKTYLNSTDLRTLAEDLNSIAQWLDERATLAEEVVK